MDSRFSRTLTFQNFCLENGCTCFCCGFFFFFFLQSELLMKDNPQLDSIIWVGLIGPVAMGADQMKSCMMWLLLYTESDWIGALNTFHIAEGGCCSAHSAFVVLENTARLKLVSKQTCFWWKERILSLPAALFLMFKLAKIRWLVKKNITLLQYWIHKFLRWSQRA